MSFRTLVSQLHLCPCASGESEHLSGGWLGQRVGEGAPRETTVPVPFSFLHPTRPRGFVRPGSPKQESLAGDCTFSPLNAGPRPALFGSPPLALFLWPGRPASSPQPPLPSSLCLSLQAPPAPPPANVALGPGPGPDSATRPSRSPRSSEGETRRAPGPGPTLCQALNTWIILVGGWVGGRVGAEPGAEGGGNVLEKGTRLQPVSRGSSTRPPLPLPPSAPPEEGGLGRETSLRASCYCPQPRLPFSIPSPASPSTPP